MTIEEIEELIESLIEAENDHTIACYLGGSSKYQGNLCAALKSDLITCIKQYGAKSEIQRSN